jgi:4-carboxymuconolactone decarboxylase
VRRQDEDLLRRLALHDEAMLESLFGPDVAEVERSDLDAKTLALVRLAGLVAVESAPASYQWIVATALAAGASEAEIVGVVAALVPIVGAVRTSSAAPEIALAVGCDLGEADER